MPQQPKITGDAQEDSWTLQATQEINEFNIRVTALRDAAIALADVSDPPTQAEVQAILNLLRNL